MNVFRFIRNTDEGIIEEKQRVYDFIPVDSIMPEDRVFHLTDNTLGVAFECIPLTGGDSKVMEHLAQVINQPYPEGTSAQFFLFKSPDITRQLTAFENLRADNTDDLLSNQMSDRMHFLREHTSSPIVLQKLTNQMFRDIGRVFDTKLVVTFKFPNKSQLPDADEYTLAKDWATKIESLLQAVPLCPYRLDAAEYIRIMQTIFNWSDNAGWKQELHPTWDENEEIYKQVIDWDTPIVKSSDRTIVLGDKKYVRTLSAKTLPPAMFFTEALGYIGDLRAGEENLRQNYAVVSNIFWGDPVKMREKIYRDRGITVNQAFSALLKFVPKLKSKLDSFNLAYDSLEKGAIAIRSSYSLILFADSEEELDAASVRAQTLWKSKHFHLFEDRNVMVPVFMNSIPFGMDLMACRELNRVKTNTSDRLPVLLPVFGEWKGSGTFHTTLISRNGQLMSLSLHDSQTNKNCVIAAESGSGKSFLLNNIISSYLQVGAKIWVIDAGKSYQKLCDINHGDFLQFDDRSKICLNPFELLTNWKDDKDMIVSLVANMASPEGRLSEVQLSMLEQYMQVLWENYGTSMTVDMIAKACLSDPDSRIQDVGKLLYAFTTKGSYGQYFNGTNNVNFKNKFTVLELDELQGRKALRQVVLLNLINQIQHDIFTKDDERGRIKILVIDEAWDLLKEGPVAVFMEHAYRKFRKYGGSAIIATQSINDLYSSEAGRPIAENSANMYLLGQKASTVDQIQREKRLSLDEGGYNLLKTVQTEAGVYSEIFVISGSGIGVGRLVVSPFENLLYSTTPQDVNRIKAYQEQGLSTAQAIQAVIQERGGKA